MSEPQIVNPIIISKEEYFALLRRDRLMTAYEQAGVDNWDAGGMVGTYLAEMDAEDPIGE